MLCRVSQGRTVFRRRTLVGLVAVGVLTCLVPTLRDVPARAQQNESQDAAHAKLSGRIFADAIWRANRQDAGAAESTGAIIAVDPGTAKWREIADRGHLVRVSPDGETIAFTKDPGEEGIWTVDTQGGNNPGRILEVGGSAVWSPDGREIITTDVHMTRKDDWKKTVFKNATWRASSLGTNRTKVPIPPTDSVEDWSPDGQWLVTTSGRHYPEGLIWQLYVMRLDGTEQRRLTEGGTNVHARFSPDSRRIVYVHRTGLRGGVFTIRVVDIVTGDTQIVYHESRPTIPRAACWSPDGKHLAVVVCEYPKDYLDLELADYRLVIMDTDGGNPRELRLPGAKVLWMGFPDWR